MRMSKLEYTFGKYGGQFVPEGFHFPLEKLRTEYLDIVEHGDFYEKLRNLYIKLELPKIYLKPLEELSAMGNLYQIDNYGKFYNALGQSLFAKESNKSEVICSAMSGLHALVTALSCNKLEIPFKIFIDNSQIPKDTLSLLSMLNSEIVNVSNMPYTNPTLYALQDWLADPVNKYLLLETAIGPAYFPSIVRNFFSLFGEEIKSLIIRKLGKEPDLIVSSCDYTSTLGVIYPYLDKDIKIIIIKTNGGEKVDTEVLGGITSVFNPCLENQEIIPPEFSYLLENGKVKMVLLEKVNNLFIELLEKEGIVFRNAKAYHALNYSLQKMSDYNLVLLLTDFPNWRG